MNCRPPALASVSSLLISLSLLSLPQNLVSARQNFCNLCEDGVNGLKYPDAVIKSDGTTCTRMTVRTAVNYEDGSTGCSQQQEAWRQICCGDERPVDVEITEVFDQYPDMDSISKTGRYNKCDLCRDGDYPSRTSMVINMLYVGEGSCPQYWKAGQQGFIPNHLCDPLRYFAYEPCGCGEFSTNGNYNWGESYDGATPSDDEAAWWSSANGGSSSNNNNDDRPWWSSANGHSSKSDDEAPWWAGADSYSGATVTTNLNIWSALLAAVATKFVSWLV